MIKGTLGGADVVFLLRGVVAILLMSEGVGIVSQIKLLYVWDVIMIIVMFYTEAYFLIR